MHLADLSRIFCGVVPPSSSRQDHHENTEEIEDDSDLATQASSEKKTSPFLTSPPPPSAFSVARQEFLAHYPQYVSSTLDTLRQTEYQRLNNSNLVYLDYTGATLYPESLVTYSRDLLASNVLGNPHSSNPPSHSSSHYTEAARTALLEFFSADSDVYTVVWTANASSAGRIVGEGYPWHEGAHLVLGQDSHNSINGLRAFAHRSGATVEYYPLTVEGGWEERWSLLERLSELRRASCHAFPGIFSLTGQSNVTGLKAPFYLLQHASAQGFHTLLDAAALAPTTKISLSDLHNCVDAMTISIYKIVGYPTGVGALIIKKSFLEHLYKPWFSGGSVDVVQVPGEAYTLEDGSPRFEDGTINFLAMPSIPHSLSQMSTWLPILSSRLPCLTHWTARSLSTIKHQRTGQPLVHVRSPPLTISPSSLSQTHGALVVFEVCDPSGAFVNCEAIEYGAGTAGICLRAGCMCNPGGTSRIAGMGFMMEGVKSGDRKDDLEVRFGIRSRGVVRASFGIASNFEDAWTFVEYMRSLSKDGALGCLLDKWGKSRFH